MILLDYGLTPEYVNRRWTEEILALIFLSRAKRIERLNRDHEDAPPAFKLVGEDQLFKEVGFQPEVVQSGRKN